MIVGGGGENEATKMEEENEGRKELVDECYHTCHWCM